MPPAPGHSRLSPRPLWFLVAIALMTAGSAWVLAGRTVNFDEWLLLRAGWLINGGHSSNIPFLMPASALLGAWAHAAQTPSDLIIGARMVTFLTVLGCLSLGLKRHAPDTLTALMALALTLANGAFFTHGFEFRYDCVILCCWMLAWACLAHPGPATAMSLGGLAAVLAMHHTKGLFYAAWLVLALPMLPGAFGRNLARFFFGLAIVFAAWIGWLRQHGQLEAAWRVYREFAALGIGHDRASVWHSLWPRISADRWWWVLVAVAGLFRLARIRTAPPSKAAWMLLPPVLFILLHPHPWDYLLAPLIPFVALMAAGEVRRGLSSGSNADVSPWRLASATVAVALLWHTTAWHAWPARNNADLQNLDLVKAVMSPADRVMDPSGALYMVPPLRPDWYRDTLWQSEETMSSTTAVNWAAPTLVVASYRMRWVHPDWQRLLSATHRPVCGWLWMRKDDARLRNVAAQCPQGVSPFLQNYWERAN